MKVRAIAVGYYGGRRRIPGDRKGHDVFDLVPRTLIKTDKDGKKREVHLTPEQQFSEKWMEKIEPTPARKPAKGSSDNEAL